MKISLKVGALAFGMALFSLVEAYDIYHAHKASNSRNPGLFKSLPGAGLMQGNLAAVIKKGGAVLTNADLRGVNLIQADARGVNFSASDLSPLPGTELEKIAQREALGRQLFGLNGSLSEIETHLRSPWTEDDWRVHLQAQKADLIAQKSQLLGVVISKSGETFLQRVARSRSMPSAARVKEDVKPVVEIDHATSLQPSRIGNLDRADLRSAKFCRANLMGANLSGTKLAGANFQGAKLTGANLEQAEVWDQQYGSADFRGARGLDKARKKLLWMKGALVDLTEAERNHYIADLSRLKHEQQALVLDELD